MDDLNGPWREGDTITTGNMNVITAAVNKVNQQHAYSGVEPDPYEEETFVIVLRQGVKEWNCRKTEISMDSHTYHRLVKEMGECKARNSLMPTREASGVRYRLRPKDNTLRYDKTIDGLELEQDYYPEVDSTLIYKSGYEFYFLCGNKDYDVDHYFENIGIYSITEERYTDINIDWENDKDQGDVYVEQSRYIEHPTVFKNDNTYDLLTPGKIVFVHPTQTSFVITPTETKDSFPCVIKYGPQCASWHYNTGYYVRSSEAAKAEALKTKANQLTGGNETKQNALQAAEMAYKTASGSDAQEKFETGAQAYLDAGGDQGDLGKLEEYLDLLDKDYDEECIRFENRWELLVVLARANLKRHLDIDFEITRDKNTGKIVWTVSNSSERSLREKLSPFFVIGWSSPTKQMTVRPDCKVKDSLEDWLGQVSANFDEYNTSHGKEPQSFDYEAIIQVITGAIDDISDWVCNAYDSEGNRIPYKITDTKNLSLLVNGTYALWNATSLLLTVTKMVPSKKYDAYIDPVLTQLSVNSSIPKEENESDSDYQQRLKDSLSEEYSTFSGQGPVVWDGNRFVPYTEPSEENKERTQEIVNEFNKAQLFTRKLRERASASKAEYTIADDGDITLPEVSRPQFVVVEKTASGTGASRSTQATTSANYVARSLRKEVLGGVRPSFGIIVSPLYEVVKSEENPWTSDFEETSLAFLEVSPKLSQDQWLRFLYCCQDRSSEISPKKLYALFGGNDYVPSKAASYFAEYLGYLNEALRYSRFIVYDGVLNTKTGQFWCKDTGEIYSYWYNINTNKQVKKPCRVDAEGVNVLYTHRLDVALFGSSLLPEAKLDESGDVVGYVLGTAPGLFYGEDTDVTGEATIPVSVNTNNCVIEIYEAAPSEDKEEGAVAPVLQEASFVPPAPEEVPVESAPDPSIHPDTDRGTVVFHPQTVETTTQTVVQETLPTTGIIRLPLVALPLRDKTVVPRINGPLNSKGESVFDGATYPEATEKESVSYSFLAAKCMGLVEPLGTASSVGQDGSVSSTEKSYQQAYYGSQEEGYIPFWLDYDKAANPTGEEESNDENENGNENGNDNSGGGDDANNNGSNETPSDSPSDTSGVLSADPEDGQSNGLAESMMLVYRNMIGNKLKAARLKNGLFKVQIKAYVNIGRKIIFYGTYVPEEGADKEVRKIYTALNLSAAEKKAIDKGDYSKAKPVYAQKVCVKGCEQGNHTDSQFCNWGDENFPSFRTFAYLPKVDDDDEDMKEIVDSSTNTTAGWVKYIYYDEQFNQPQPEQFTVLPPVYEDEFGVECTIIPSKTGWTYQGWFMGKERKYFTLNPLLLTPFAKVYSKNQEWGSATVVSVDKTAPYAAHIAYNPLYNSKGERLSRTYDQVGSFPFVVGDLPNVRTPLLTTMTYKAQRADWVPAIAPNLDQNEILLPGTVVEINKTSATLYLDKEDRTKTATFDYYIVEPPDSYTTTTEGTPYTKIIKFVKKEPSVYDLESHRMEEDDIWLSSIITVSKLPICEAGGAEYYVGVALKKDGTPLIRQPYGIFNDCDNNAHLGLFLKHTPRGMTYPCTFRIDYVPYGYAVPSKTPACYYRASGDNCAANIISSQYILKRVVSNDTSTLQLTGACYVPSSTLTVLG